MSYDHSAFLVSAASDNICMSNLQALHMHILQPNGPRSSVLDNSMVPYKLVISSRCKGPGVEANTTCGSKELDTTHTPCNTDPPGMGAKFTAIGNSGASCAASCFLVGGLSNNLMFGRQVFITSLHFWTHGKLLLIAFNCLTLSESTCDVPLQHHFLCTQYGNTFSFQVLSGLRTRDSPANCASG